MPLEYYFVDPNYRINLSERQRMKIDIRLVNEDLDDFKVIALVDGAALVREMSIKYARTLAYAVGKNQISCTDGCVVERYPIKLPLEKMGDGQLCLLSNEAGNTPMKIEMLVRLRELALQEHKIDSWKRQKV